VIYDTPVKGFGRDPDHHRDLITIAADPNTAALASV
jgi:hypothetical protein